MAPQITKVFEGPLCLETNETSEVRFLGTGINCMNGNDAKSADVHIDAFDATKVALIKWTKFGGNNHLKRQSGQFIAQLRRDLSVNSEFTDFSATLAGIDHFIVTVENPPPDNGSDESDALPANHFVLKTCVG